MGLKIEPMPFFSSDKIFSKLRAQILQMRYQNVPEGLDCREKDKSESFNLSSCSHQSKFTILNNKSWKIQ